VVAQDESDLPCARPVFQVFLALDREADVVEVFDMNETLQAVFAREALREIRMVLNHALREIAGDADIQRAVWAIGEDVDPAAGHASSKESNSWVVGTSPAMTK